MKKNLTLDYFYVHNFRGLNHLKLEDFSNVNIFVGANNSGKTSILEALKIFSAPDDIGQVVRLALQRAQGSSEIKKKNLINYLMSIFQKVQEDEDNVQSYRISLEGMVRKHIYHYDVDGTIGEVTDSSGLSKKTLGLAIGTSVDNGKVSYKSFEIINDTENTFVSTQKHLYSALYLHSSVSYYRSCAALLSDYIVSEGKKEVLQILQTFDKNVDDISVVGEDVYLHNLLSGSMPLFAYGSGMQKAVFLTIAIIYCKNGVILVDEIDNAIHVSAFEDVFRWFLNTCLKYNVQAFVTTHSIEALDVILRIAYQEHTSDDALRIITLRKNYKDNITKGKVRTGEEAFADRAQFKMELRV